MSSGIIYQIEGGLDFFNELKNMATSVAHQTTSDRCLITDEKLTKDHITLKCGHKFNYVPLFKEVIFQKCSLLPKNVSSSIVTTYTKNAMTASAASTLPTPSNNPQSNITVVSYNSSYNLDTTKLHYNEIKCPYCRSITQNILPFYPYPEVNKIKYVNSPPELSLQSVSCEFYQHKEPTAENICRTGCIYHEKYDMMLCSKHFNKLEAEQQQEQEKQKKKPIRRKVNNTTSAANVIAENVIVSHHNPALPSSCSFVLLSGPRKGCPCGKPTYSSKVTTSINTNLSLCKTHYEKGNAVKSS